MRPSNQPVPVRSGVTCGFGSVAACRRHRAPATTASTAGRPAAAWGYGLATYAGTEGEGGVLDTWFPAPRLGAPDADLDAPGELARLEGVDEVRGVRRLVVRTVVEDLQAAAGRHRRTPGCGCTCSATGWSRRTRSAWTASSGCSPTSCGPTPARAPSRASRRTRLRLTEARGQVTVLGVDKFPRMTDYVLPTGVRIADADRVRLGAHLAEGTTVMHEGFVNYNAGTLGASMVEGRISAGVVVGDGSDVGGGASIMGTLSGGGKEVISVGERCLLGANAGIGISLGDDCVVEAGCYVTAGTKVTVLRRRRRAEVVKAAELSGAEQRAVPPQLHHRRRRGGAVERATASSSTPPCMPTDGRTSSGATGAGAASSLLAVLAVVARRRRARPTGASARCPTPRAARRAVGGVAVDLSHRAGRERHD